MSLFCGSGRGHATAFLESPSKLAVQTLSCRATGADINFHDGLARVFCTPHCEADAWSVAVGAAVHPVRSSVCEAAIVDGVLPQSGGEMLVSKVRGLPAYVGQEAGGGMSIAATNLGGDAFHLAPWRGGDADPHAVYPPKLEPGCGGNLASLGLATAQPGSTFVFRCPMDCATEGQVYGGPAYAAQSEVCAAARHAGIMGAAGGHGLLTIGAGQDHYFDSRGADGQESTEAPGSGPSFTLSIPTAEDLARVSRGKKLVGLQYAGASALGGGSVVRAREADRKSVV